MQISGRRQAQARQMPSSRPKDRYKYERHSIWSQICKILLAHHTQNLVSPVFLASAGSTDTANTS